MNCRIMSHKPTFTWSITEPEQICCIFMKNSWQTKVLRFIYLKLQKKTFNQNIKAFITLKFLDVDPVTT